MSEHSRREMLALAGGVAVVAGAGGLVAEADAAPQHVASAAATDGVLDLFVNEGLVPMVDDSLVYMRGFGAAPTDMGVARPEPAHHPAGVPGRRAPGEQPQLPARRGAARGGAAGPAGTASQPAR